MNVLKIILDIFPIPGASAVSTAVSISGFHEKYFFYGFFPEKNTRLKEDFEKLSNLDGSIVFFISPRKFNRSIQELKNYFMDRKILFVEKFQNFMKNI